jgi:hypothetical protein
METEMSPQGMRYESALESGSLPQTGQTRQQITTSRARPITREHPRGSLKTARSKTGCQEVPFYGSTENVCLPSLLFRCSNHDVSRLGQRAQGRASSGLSFPINRGRFRELMSTTSSAIIQHIRALCEPEPRKAYLAYFYFDFRDKEKQNARNLITSILSQLSALSDTCCGVICRLYSTHGNGTQKPTDDDLTKCLRQMLSVLAEHPTYIVMDALDECPDDSGWPKTPREEALDVVRDLVGLPLPNLRICVTSRPEVDIKSVLNPLTIYAVSLHDQSEQKKGIADYIRTIVNSDRKMNGWPDEDKELVIKELSERADGM